MTKSAAVRPERVSRPPRRDASFGDVAHDTFPTTSDRARHRAQVERIQARADLLAAIEQVRARVGLPKAEVARRVGTRPSVISRLLASEGSNPTVDTLLELLQTLRVGGTLTLHTRRTHGQVLRIRIAA